MVFKLGSRFFIFGQGILFPECAGIGTVATPPTGNDAADNRPDAVFTEEVQRSTVILHADDEVDSAIGQIFDMRLRTGIRTKMVRTDVQAAAVHPARFRDIVRLLGGQELTGQQNQDKGKEMLFHAMNLWDTGRSRCK